MTSHFESQRSLDFSEGRRLRDVGMQRVADNSAHQWKAAVRSFALNWINSRGLYDTFTGEDIRLAALAVGIAEPHHHNAWSSVVGGQIRSWLRSRVIESAGVVVCKDPRAHARKLMLYRKSFSQPSIVA